MKRALEDAAPSIIDISRCPGSVTSPPSRVYAHHHISLCPPPIGTIKVNTDESFSNGLTLGGIGGIFYYDQRNSLLHFAK